MHELSHKILESYQVRKTKKQKTEFIELLKRELPKADLKIEQGGFCRSRNIVIGDVESAEYILGAHYDTQPVLPFPNFLTPKNMLIYLLYMMLLVLIISIPMGIASGVVGYLTKDGFWGAVVSYIVLLIFLGMMLFGPANKHTANDNTSGVITLIEAYYIEEIRQKAAFVFFDHEEIGLFGSMYFAKKHKKTMGNKLLINFDCVSDGDTIMLIQNKSAKKQYEDRLKAAFLSNEEKTALITNASNTLYPSDQANFKCSIGVAAFKKNKLFGYYLDRIHTPKDTVFDEKNIAFIIEAVCRFLTQTVMP